MSLPGHFATSWVGELSEAGTPRYLASLGDIPRLKLGRVHFEHGAKPAAVGAQVAKRIARGIKP